MKALLFAAGKGTRLRPFTDHHPKALAKVNGVTLLERNIRFLNSYGIYDFVINVHHFASQITEFLQLNNNFGSKIEISDESEELLETGGGMVFAKNKLQDQKEFLIMNTDILTTLPIDQLLSSHNKSGALATLAVSERSSSRKLLFDSEMKLQGWENSNTGEQKLASDPSLLTPYAFSGVHVVSSRIFDKIEREGKFSIIDEYLDLMNQEKIIGFLHTSLLIDVGRPESVLEAEKFFNYINI